MQKPSNLETQKPSNLGLVFFGTPEYVVPVLEALKNASYEIAAVVTRAPKPVGRKQILTPSPVSVWAKKKGIKIFDASPKEIVEGIKKIGAQVAILAAYGRLIPQDLIDIFPYGILNIHPSLLPKYRGASPIETVLVTGEKETGVTIIKLDAELDHGPIISQFREAIKPEDTRVTLRERLFRKAAEALVTILPAYLEGKIELREQKHEEATFTNLMKKEDGFIPAKYLAATLEGKTINEKWEIPFIRDYTLVPSAQCLERFIQAVNPWPGAWTNVKLTINNVQLQKRLKILKAHLEELPITKLVPDRVQLEGKKPVTWQQFRQGYPGAEF